MKQAMIKAGFKARKRPAYRGWTGYSDGSQPSPWYDEPGSRKPTAPRWARRRAGRMTCPYCRAELISGLDYCPECNRTYH